MALRTAIVLVILTLILTPEMSLHAQALQAQYGSNPLERLDGPDYASREYPGRTNVAPNYTGRYSLLPVTGGDAFRARFWDPRYNGSSGNDPYNGMFTGGKIDPKFLDARSSKTFAVNPRLLTSLGTFYGNPFKKQWWDVPGRTYGARGAAAPSSTTLGVSGFPTFRNPPNRTTTDGSGGSATPPPVATENSGPPVVTESNPNPGDLNSRHFPTTVGSTLCSAGGFGMMPKIEKKPSMVPTILGGVLGVALGASLGGAAGGILGGIGGALVGNFVAGQAAEAPYEGFVDNANAGYYGQYGGVPFEASTSASGVNPWLSYSYSSDYYDMYYTRKSGILTWLPGVAGAVIGGALGAQGGIMGLLVGGGLGFVAGNIIEKVLFPQSNYDSYGIGNVFPMQDPYNDLTLFRSQLAPTVQQACYREVNGITPVGEQTSSMSSQGCTHANQPVTGSAATEGKSLEVLRTEYFSRIKTLQVTVQSGSNEDQIKAKKDYEAARDAYFKARSQPNGSAGN